MSRLRVQVVLGLKGEPRLAVWLLTWPRAGSLLEDWFGSIAHAHKAVCRFRLGHSILVSVALLAWQRCRSVLICEMRAAVSRECTDGVVGW